MIIAFSLSNSQLGTIEASERSIHEIHSFSSCIDGLLLHVLQQPFPCLLHQKQITSALPDVVLPHVFGLFGVDPSFLFAEHRMLSRLEQTRIKRLGLSCCFNQSRRLTTLKDGLDLGNESWNLRSEFFIGFGGFKKIEKLLADQILKGLLRAEVTRDVFRGFTLFDPLVASLFWLRG